MLLSLLTEVRASGVAARPRVQKRLGGQRHLCGDPSRNCSKIGLRSRSRPLNIGRISIPPAVTKNLRQTTRAASSTSGRNGWTSKPAWRKASAGGVHCGPRLCGHWGATIVFEISDAQFSDFVLAGPAQGHGSGTGVAVVGALHHF